MPGPNTFWLVLTNILLGALVVLCVMAVVVVFACAVVSRFCARRASDAELDRDMREMFGPQCGTRGRHGPHRTR